MLKKIFSKRLVLFSCLLLAYGCNGDGGVAPVADNIGKPNPADPTNIQAIIKGVTVSSPPVVTFDLLDQNGSPLDPNEVIKSGGSVRFTIAQLGTDGYYRNYIKSSTPGQPGYDSGGTFARIGTGVYTYAFKTNITDSTKTLGNLAYNTALTHTVAAQIQRGSEGPSQQAVNPYLNFRPDGGAVTSTREIVAISNCNKCHQSLRLHGGGRREIALCILCHYPGIVDPDTGNSIDMKSLVHKIHYGALLPSNVGGGDFTIVGFNNTYNSYKTVNYPDFSNDGTINRTPADCVKCHQVGQNLSKKTYGKDVDKYKANPTMDKCLTCHANVTFDGSTSYPSKNGILPVTLTNVRNHSGGNVSDPTRTDSSKCVGCHPTGTPGVDEYNSPATIVGAHTVLEKSTLAAGKEPQLIIVGVQNAIAGLAPTITFSIKQNDGTAVPFTGNSFALRIAYFPPDKLDYTNEKLPSGSTHSGQPIAGATLSTTNTIVNGDGTFSFTFPANLAIPAGLTGTGVVTLDGRRGDLAYSTPHKGNVTTGRLSGLPDQWFFDLATGVQVTDTAKQRRQVVDDAKCLNCHDLLRGHGGSRVEVRDCVTCHNPNAVAAANDPLTNNEAFDFKYMIHKIHTGEDMQATVPYFNDSFKEIRFPGIKGNCLGCHIPNSYILPLKDGVIGTSLATISRSGASSANPIPNDSSKDTKLGPYASACISCHDNPTVKTGHTDMMINNEGKEICSSCHVANSVKAVETVHPILK